MRAINVYLIKNTTKEDNINMRKLEEILDAFFVPFVDNRSLDAFFEKRMNIITYKYDHIEDCDNISINYITVIPVIENEEYNHVNKYDNFIKDYMLPISYLKLSDLSSVHFYDHISIYLLSLDKMYAVVNTTDIGNHIEDSYIQFIKNINSIGYRPVCICNDVD